MTKLTQVPYPRPSFKTYCFIALGIASSISFILIFFQPFGTAQFKHEYKNLILSGYGTAVFVTMVIFYFLSTAVVHKNRASHWTIVLEVMDVFFALILSITACYLYINIIFDYPFHFKSMLSFMSIAMTVAILPVLACLAFLYYRWKDVIDTTIQKSPETEAKKEIHLLIGPNKTNQIKAQIDQILFIKAQDNYVMLFLKKVDKIQRHMLRCTLKQIKEQLLDEDFIQTHRSYIVNSSKISQLLGNKSKAQIEIVGYDKTIPVSRSYFEHIKSLAQS